MFTSLRESFLMWVFLKAGSRLFDTVVVYAPGDEQVRALHFATSEFHLRQSMLDFLGEGNGETAPQDLA